MSQRSRTSIGAHPDLWCNGAFPCGSGERGGDGALPDSRFAGRADPTFRHAGGRCICEIPRDLVFARARARETPIVSSIKGVRIALPLVVQLHPGRHRARGRGLSRTSSPLARLRGEQTPLPRTFEPRPRSRADFVLRRIVRLGHLASGTMPIHMWWRRRKAYVRRVGSVERSPAALECDAGQTSGAVPR